MSNTLDGFIAEAPVALQIISNNPELGMARLTEKGFELDESQVSIAIGIRKSDVAFQQQLNEALAQISVDQRKEWKVEAINRSSTLDHSTTIPNGLWTAH